MKVLSVLLMLLILSPAILITLVVKLSITEARTLEDKYNEWLRE